MKEERMKILELLQNGLISVAEAEELLRTLEPTSSSRIIQKPEKASVITRRMLRIVIDSSDGDNVNIRIPVEFAKLLKSGKISEKLVVNNEHIDIEVDEIIRMAEDGLVGDLVDVESADGEKIRIFIE